MTSSVGDKDPLASVAMATATHYLHDAHHSVPDIYFTTRIKGKDPVLSPAFSSFLRFFPHLIIIINK